MSRRIGLVEGRVSTEFYLKFLKFTLEPAQKLVLQIFGPLKSRKKVLVNELNFKSHTTEYVFTNFYEDVNLDGIFEKVIIKSKESDALINGLVELSNFIGNKTTYDEMVAKFINVGKHKLGSGVITELIPEMVYCYGSQVNLSDLILRTEYYVGGLIVDILDVWDANGVEKNFVKRVHQTRAKMYAKARLAKWNNQLFKLKVVNQ